MNRKFRGIDNYACQLDRDAIFYGLVLLGIKVEETGKILEEYKWLQTMRILKNKSRAKRIQERYVRAHQRYIGVLSEAISRLPKMPTRYTWKHVGNMMNEVYRTVPAHKRDLVRNQWPHYRTDRTHE